MYYLYIDESGDPGDYRDKNEKIILRSSRYFTLGGIIVDEQVRSQFYSKYAEIIGKYFTGINLPTSFKLHYNPLRMNIPPYDKLSRQQKLELEDEVLSTIKTLNCNLLSVTIDLESHCEKYSSPAHPTAYALIVMLERFQYFLGQKDSKGLVTYERFNSTLRKKVAIEAKWLREKYGFPTPTNLDDLQKLVNNGDPTKEPMLQFADFFAYIPWIRKTSKGVWEKFIDRYHNFYGAKFVTGNVEIE